MPEKMNRRGVTVHARSKSFENWNAKTAKLWNAGAINSRYQKESQRAVLAVSLSSGLFEVLAERGKFFLADRIFPRVVNIKKSSIKIRKDLSPFYLTRAFRSTTPALIFLTVARAPAHVHRRKIQRSPVRVRAREGKTLRADYTVGQCEKYYPLICGAAHSVPVSLRQEINDHGPPRRAAPFQYDLPTERLSAVREAATRRK